MTIREMVLKIQNEVLGSENLLPNRAAELLAQLSALYGNVLDRIQETEFVYKKILLLAYDIEKTSNRATIKAEVSNEYQEYKEAINTEKLVKQLIGSLKYFLKNREEEMRLGKFQ